MPVSAFFMGGTNGDWCLSPVCLSLLRGDGIAVGGAAHPHLCGTVTIRVFFCASSVCGESQFIPLRCGCCWSRAGRFAVRIFSADGLARFRRISLQAVPDLLAYCTTSSAALAIQCTIPAPCYAGLSARLALRRRCWPLPWTKRLYAWTHCRCILVLRLIAYLVWGAPHAQDGRRTRRAFSFNVIPRWVPYLSACSHRPERQRAGGTDLSGRVYAHISSAANYFDFIVRVAGSSLFLPGDVFWFMAFSILHSCS